MRTLVQSADYLRTAEAFFKLFQQLQKLSDKMGTAKPQHRPQIDSNISIESKIICSLSTYEIDIAQFLNSILETGEEAFEN